MHMMTGRPAHVFTLMKHRLSLEKVSEHASWSSQYYGRIISAALAATGTLLRGALWACAPSNSRHTLTLLATESQPPEDQCDGIAAQLCCTAGAPADLVQIVTGYGDAGNALVTGGVDKLIFVGSTKARPCAPHCKPAAAHQQPAGSTRSPPTYNNPVFDRSAGWSWRRQRRR
jgi:hypothetical protein